MAFTKANKLSEEAVAKVAGGIDYANNFGDHSIYVLGLTENTHAYTFAAADKQRVKDIISGLDYSKCKNFDEANAIAFAALKAEPGLLTPIPGCPEEWY